MHLCTLIPNFYALCSSFHALLIIKNCLPSITSNFASSWLIGFKFCALKIQPIDVTFDSRLKRLSEKPCKTPIEYEFFQLQFPPSRICQCFAWIFVNGFDEYLSISFPPHVTQRCQTGRVYQVSFKTFCSHTNFALITHI